MRKSLTVVALIAVACVLSSRTPARADLPAGVSWKITQEPKAVWGKNEQGNWIVYLTAQVQITFPAPTVGKPNYYQVRFGPWDKSAGGGLGNPWQTFEGWVPADGGVVTCAFHTPAPVRFYDWGGSWCYLDLGLYEYDPLFLTLLNSWFDGPYPYWVEIAP